MSARRTRRLSRDSLRLQSLEGRIAPSTFTVANSNNSGAGSLRQAVLDANSNPGADLIDFSSYFNVPRTITLANTININGAVTIDGTSADNVKITVSNYVGIFDTRAAPAGATVAFVDLTLDGSAGNFGAVFAYDEALSATRCNFTDNIAYYGSGGAITVEGGGSLIATDCNFTGNVAGYGSGGAITVQAIGSLTATNCTFTGNTASDFGGAIAARGGAAVSLTQCAVMNNYAYWGGGMAVRVLLLEACSVSGNTAGDIEYPGFGGGIFVEGTAALGAVTIRNSTISGNSLKGSGGGIAFSGNLVVQNSTITANTASVAGGGIAGDTISLESCIVAKNAAPTGPDIKAATVNSKTSTIFSHGGISTFNDLAGNRPAGEDPLLGALTDNGGPTLTHRLLPGSPCVGAGSNPTNLATDQRGAGFPRVLNGLPDMGAVEDSSPAVALVSLPTTVTTSGGTSYAIVVRYYDDIGIDLTTIDLNDISVTGPGYAAPQSPTALSVAGSGNSVTVTYTLPAPQGVFDAADNGAYTATLKPNQVSDTDVPVQHFVLPSVLGTFRVAIPFALVVDEVSDVDDGNTAKGHVSLREAVRLTNAVPNSTDTITFDPSAFSAPTTIKLTSGAFTITDPLAIIGPGAAALTLDAAGQSRLFTVDPGASSVVTLTGMTLINGASFSGGGISANCGLNLFDVVIGKCSAMGQYPMGGGVFSGGPLTAKNCTFVGNSTVPQGYLLNSGLSYGGAIFAKSGLLLEASTVSGNSSLGGFYYLGENYTQVYFPGIAGGVSVDGNSTIRNCTISGNSATYFGGVYAGPLVVQNSTITGNSGGDIAGSVVSLESSLVTWITASTVNAKTSSVFYLGTVVYNNLGGNRPVGEDPLLGPLQDNGGPTKTHALLPGSPCINTGSNPANLTSDQRGSGFVRVYNGQADIGAFELQPAPPPACVSGKTVIINGGIAQRSRVTSVTIDFDQIVTLPINPADAFQLKRQTDNAVVALTASVMTDSATHVTLTFAGTLSQFGSLEDGRYTMTVFASKVSNANGKLDGDCNGIGGDDFVLVSTGTIGVFRLFGDADGNGSVTAADFNAFRLAYGSTGPSIFDFDGDNQVSASDFNSFRTRYGVTI